MSVVNKICRVIGLMTFSILLSAQVNAQDFIIEDSLYEKSKNKATIISPLTVKKLNQAQVLVDEDRFGGAR